MIRFLPCQRQQPRGFSLVEMLVVIAILALVATVGATRLSGPNEATVLKAEARKLVSHLRATRSMSLAKSRVFTVEAVEGGAGYAIRPGEEIVQLPDTLTLSLSPGRRIGPALNDDPAIAFYPDGSASGGSITLAGPSGGQRITVNWMTGEVALAPQA